MKPIIARVLRTLIVLALVIGATVLLNSRFHGNFGVGIVLILVPFLGLSFSLPYLLLVRCERCSGRMQFHFLKRLGASSQMFGYVCERCGRCHEWEGASSATRSRAKRLSISGFGILLQFGETRSPLHQPIIRIVFAPRSTAPQISIVNGETIENDLGYL